LDNEELEKMRKFVKESLNLDLHYDYNNLFKNLDLDGDGKIDFNEFLTAAIDHRKLLTKKNIDHIFRTFDTDGDGEISVEEFQTALPTNYRSTMQNIEGQGA
jgi:calcium-dependent protein kinase